MIIAPSFTPRGANADEKKLLALLLLDDDDYTSAERRFERHVPPAYRGIITGDGWTWDADRQLYVRRNGRVLADSDLKNIMLLFVLAEEHELEDNAEAMVRGDITVEQWQTTAAETIRDTYVASGLVAAGGADRIQPEDVAAVVGTPATETTSGTGLTDALTRLNRFGNQVVTHDAGDSAGVIRRGGLYAAPANGVYETVKRNSHGRMAEASAVALEERNILDDAAQHCRTTEFTDGCPEISDASWADFGTYPLPGLRTCGPRCRCRMVYRVKASDKKEPPG